MRRPFFTFRRFALVMLVFVVPLLLVLYVLGPRWLASRQQALEVEGVVAEKGIGDPYRHERYRRNTGILRYFLIVRQENGELVTLRVPGEIYQQARVGMPVRKKAGEPQPTLGEAAPSP